MTAEPGLRERKKLATRRALELAAIRLAVERGLDNVLVEDIAASAGVSPRTFNNYFGSKYEAICGLAVDRARRIGAALRELPADEPLWEAITRVVVAEYTMDGKPDPGWQAGVRLVTSAPALRGEYLKAHATVVDAITEAIAERTGTDPARDMLPRILAGAVTGASEVALDHWLNVDPDTSLQNHMRAALDQLASISDYRSAKS